MHKTEERKRTELGHALNAEFLERIAAAETAGSTEEARFIRMAREVEEYVGMRFEEALCLYDREPELFADGFCALVDPVRNVAPEAQGYRELLRRAIDHRT